MRPRRQGRMAVGGLVTCWAGGTNVWSKTDWTPLAGREVSLWADGDAPGHKAMLGLAAHLHGLGCKVRIALPTVELDSDVADWIAEGGPAGAAQILARLLTDYEPPEAQPVRKYRNGFPIRLNRRRMMTNRRLSWRTSPTMPTTGYLGWSAPTSPCGCTRRAWYTRANGIPSPGVAR